MFEVSLFNVLRGVEEKLDSHQRSAFQACAPFRQLLRDLAKGYTEYPQLNAEVLAISQNGIEELGQLQRELDLPFPLLSDVEGRVLSAYIGQATGGIHETAILVADRWGSLYNKATAADADASPGEEDPRLAILY